MHLIAFHTGATGGAVLVPVRPARNIMHDAKIGKRNRIQRTEMSFGDHQNETTEAADAAAIAPNRAKNHRNIQVRKINQNHHRMTAHSARSKAMCHPNRIANGIITNYQHH